MRAGRAYILGWRRRQLRAERRVRRRRGAVRCGAEGGMRGDSKPPTSAALFPAGAWGDKAGAEIRRPVGLLPASRPWRDLGQGVGRTTGLGGCPRVPSPGIAPRPWASLPPRLGSCPAGEDGCLGALRGEKSPSQQFPVFSVTLFLSLSPPPGAGVPAPPLSDGQARVGRERGEGGRRARPARSPRPSLPRHRRSPNWRGTGFPTAAGAAEPGWSEWGRCLTPLAGGGAGAEKSPLGRCTSLRFRGAGVCFVNM